MSNISSVWLNQTTSTAGGNFVYAFNIGLLTDASHDCYIFKTKGTGKK